MKEKLWWAQNQQGYVYLTQPESPLRPGFQKFSTAAPSEMDRIYAKLDKQEKLHYAQMTAQMYEKRKDFIESNLSNLRTRLANSNSEEEKDVIRAWLQAFNNRMDKLMNQTVHGVAEIQKHAAPIPVERPLITAEDIREKPVIIHDLDKIVHVDLRSVKPETEAIQ